MDSQYVNIISISIHVQKFTNKLVLCIFIMCVCIYILLAHMSMYHVHACRVQKEVLDLLELEVQMFVNHHMDAGN